MAFTVVAHLTLENARKALDFYAEAFGGEIVQVVMEPDGEKLWHGVLQFGEVLFYVNDPFPEVALTVNQSAVWLKVPDVDAAFERAVKAGAQVTMPLENTFWGDRMCMVTDPWGQKWTIATHLRDPSREEFREGQKAYVEHRKTLIAKAASKSGGDA